MSHNIKSEGRYNREIDYTQATSRVRNALPGNLLGRSIASIVAGDSCSRLIDFREAKMRGFLLLVGIFLFSVPLLGDRGIQIPDTPPSTELELNNLKLYGKNLSQAHEPFTYQVGGEDNAVALIVLNRLAKQHNLQGEASRLANDLAACKELLRRKSEATSRAGAKKTIDNHESQEGKP